MAQPIVTDVRFSKHPCGFCAHTQSHEKCPSGVLNGNMTQVLRCPCGCPRSLEVRCIKCNSREQSEISPETWTCLDADGCEARREHKILHDPVIQSIRALSSSAKKQERAAKQEQRAASSRRGGGGQPSLCLHCGEPTKGGRFLPGHDAAFLSFAVKQVREGENTADNIRASWRILGISDALTAKFEKRIAA